MATIIDALLWYKEFEAILSVLLNSKSEETSFLIDGNFHHHPGETITKFFTENEYSVTVEDRTIFAKKNNETVGLAIIGFHKNNYLIFGDIIQK